MAKWDEIPALVRGTILSMPYALNWAQGLSVAEVLTACEVNKEVGRVVLHYGGAERFIQMTDAGRMDPRLWPLGLPKDPPPPAPPEVLPASVGGANIVAGEPAWLPRVEKKLDKILAIVSKG